MSSRRRQANRPVSQPHRTRAWRLLRLEDRLAPAIAIMGPHTPQELNQLRRTAGAAWTALAEVPMPTAPVKPAVTATSAWYFSLNSLSLTDRLADAPAEFTPRAEDGSFVVSLPRPDGSFQRFRTWEVALMEPGLAAQFPTYKTYRGQGIDDPRAVFAGDVTVRGFHAQVLSPNGAYYIDPYYRNETSVYVAYYKQNLHNVHNFVCYVGSEEVAGDDGCGGCGCGCAACQSAARVLQDNGGDPVVVSTPPSGGISQFNTSNGTTLRTYRLACAATGEYTAFFGGSVAQGQAAIVTAVNRVSGVYESQLAVRLVLVANNSNLVYTDGATDPYTNGSGGTMLGQNQTNIDTVIGNANYDIGHVFSTGGGGVAGLGVVGVTGQKARGVTGSGSPTGDAFWIDYVAHEMGHQYGANHTFNGVSGSCAGGNRNGATAYEQGSGSTIMAYAGICGTDNLQPNSDPYFHWKSLDEISTYISSGAGVGNTQTPTGNAIPVPNAGGNFTIPASTPFALTGSATDANGDPLTYLWEEADLGPATAVTAPDNGTSPLFRSFNPTADSTRTFPRLSNLLAGTNSVGEVYATTNRSLNFRLTVFDNRTTGAFAFVSNKLTVVNTGSAFAVTSPNTAVSWQGNSLQTVTWNVAGTTANGINAANVNILLSTDGGLTFPTTLAANTPNDGSESITLPNTPTGSARIKVQPVGNVFFDVSDKNFTITAGSTMQVTGTSPAVGSLVTTPVTQIDFTFSAAVAAGTIGTNDITLSQGTVTKAELQSAQTVRYTLAGITAEGTLNVSMAAGAVTDTSANPVGPFAGNYTVDVGTEAFPVPLLAAAPVGSLTYTGSVAGTVNTGTDTDAYTVILDAGQAVTALVTPAAGLRPAITLTGPGGVNQSFSAPTAGSAALLQTVAAANAGLYTLTVSSAASTTGTYTLGLTVNAAIESENVGGPSNGTTGTAEALGAFFDLGGGAGRAAVRGRVNQVGGSLASETEPNNSTTDANDATADFTTISSNLYQMGISGSISGSTDTDYFNIGQLQAGDILTITQSGSGSSRGTLGDPLVQLYSTTSGSTTVTANDDAGYPTFFDALVYRFTITTTDTYYVRANKFSGTGSYQLALYLENTGTAPTTGGTFVTEVESNNTVASANNASTSWRAVGYRSTITGTAADSDFFRYTFNAGDLITARLTAGGGLDARLNIRNAAGTIVAAEPGASTALGASSAIYGYRVATAGTYYVEVLPNSGSGSYTLDIDLSANTAPPTAQPDTDLYSFTLGAGEAVAIGMDALNAGTINLSLLDAGGFAVATGVAGATNYDQTLTFTAVGGGTYYASVVGSNVDYNLVVSRGAALDREANDSFAAAQLLTGNRAFGAVSGSDDWYVFPATAGQLLTLTTATPGDGPGEFVNLLDPLIELYDPSNVLVASDDNSALDGRNAVLTKAAAMTGDYRVRVRGAGGTAGEYVLALSASNDPPPAVAGTPIVNDGSAQRSRVDSLTVTFSEIVTLGGGAFQLTRTGPGSPTGNVAVAVDTSGSTPTETVAKLTFSGSLTEFGSLIDGLYTLTVVAGQVADASLQPLAGGDYLFDLHRLFGDNDGDRDVDAGDYGAFRQTFGATLNLAFDFDNDSDVDASDYGQFRLRFGTSV